MGDRDRIRWDDWTSEPEGDPGQREREWDAEDVVRAPTPRGRRVIALVVFAVFLATVALCCVAVGEAGQLFWLEPPPP